MARRSFLEFIGHENIMEADGRAQVRPQSSVPATCKIETWREDVGSNPEQ
jgi:hypothetical protein